MFQKTLAFRVFFIFSLILIGCFVFLPLLWMINTALKPADKTFTLYFFAGELTLENIIGILTDKTIMTYLKNSLIVSFLSSFMATLVSSFAAYSFSKFRYRGRKAIMGAFMMSQLLKVPLQGKKGNNGSLHDESGISAGDPAACDIPDDAALPSARLILVPSHKLHRVHPAGRDMDAERIF